MESTPWFSQKERPQWEQSAFPMGTGSRGDDIEFLWESIIDSHDIGDIWYYRLNAHFYLNTSYINNIGHQNMNYFYMQVVWEVA